MTGREEGGKVKKLKNILNKLKNTICAMTFVLDSIFFIGVIILILTNFIVNPVFGLYSVALFLIGLSVYLANTKENK